LAERLPFTFLAYRYLTAAATPLSGLVLARRLRRGKEHPDRLGERRGRPSLPRPQEPLVWLHAATSRPAPTKAPRPRMLAILAIFVMSMRQ